MQFGLYIHIYIYIFSFLGYKFETLSLMPNQWDDTTREYIEGREELVVNNSAQYCSLARTGFGKTKIIIGGEVDGRKLFCRNIL